MFTLILTFSDNNSNYSTGRVPGYETRQEAVLAGNRWMAACVNRSYNVVLENS